VRVGALDDARAAGWHDENRVGSRRLEHIPEGQGIAASGTGGGALEQVFFSGNFHGTFRLGAKNEGRAGFNPLNLAIGL